VELVGLSGGVPPVVPSNTVGALKLGQRFRKRMIKNSTTQEEDHGMIIKSLVKPAQLKRIPVIRIIRCETQYDISSLPWVNKPQPQPPL
jgi:hypothetical protein